MRNTFLRKFVGSSVLALMILAGCERAGPLEDEGGVDATLTTIQTRIFDLNCALSGCHAGSSPQLGLSLENGLAFSNIVGVQSDEVNLLRVDPGNPEESYLLKKVRGDADIVGARMPLGRADLSDENIELIRQWIADGAEDN